MSLEYDLTPYEYEYQDHDYSYDRSQDVLDQIDDYLDHLNDYEDEDIDPFDWLWVEEDGEDLEPLEEFYKPSYEGLTTAANQLNATKNTILEMLDNALFTD